MLKAMWNDENGAIVSIEMIIIITVGVLALIVGWSEVAVAVNSELDDISNAVGKLNQSYQFIGFGSLKLDGTQKNLFFGSAFTDAPDDCDSCLGQSAIVCAAGSGPTAAGG
jgi:Flp pilus assembly pilin Flp